MDQLRSLLERLGAPGAARNAELAVHARQEEDQLVATLAERLGTVATQAA